MFKKLTLLSFFISLTLMAHSTRTYLGAPLEIIKVGHPTLRMTAKEVTQQEIQTETFQTFIDDMIETMKASGGVGLAAPQVNTSKRIFVMKSGRSVPLTVVINPKVKYLSRHGKKSSNEGCLSIPGKRVKVQRFRSIHMDYWNRHGEDVSKEMKGFGAIIAQHEFDHLNGVLIVDFLDPFAEYVDPDDYVTVPLM